MATPTLAQAPIMSPEQSQALGPVPPHRYGSPIWAIAKVTAASPLVLPVKVSPLGPEVGLAGSLGLLPSPPDPGHGTPGCSTPGRAAGGAVSPAVISVPVVFAGEPVHNWAVSAVASGSHWAYRPR